MKFKKVQQIILFMPSKDKHKLPVIEFDVNILKIEENWIVVRRTAGSSNNAKKIRLPLLVKGLPRIFSEDNFEVIDKDKAIAMILNGHATTPTHWKRVIWESTREELFLNFYRRSKITECSNLSLLKFEDLKEYLKLLKLPTSKLLEKNQLKEKVIQIEKLVRNFKNQAG